TDQEQISGFRSKKETGKLHPTNHIKSNQIKTPEWGLFINQYYEQLNAIRNENSSTMRGPGNNRRLATAPGPKEGI
ncbi:MAG: hypothetical protein AAF361_04395, partial [Bacteroidota bacterium]